MRWLLRLFCALMLMLSTTSVWAQSREKIIDGENVYLLPHETKRLYRFNTVTRVKEMVLEFDAAPLAFLVKDNSVYAIINGAIFVFDLQSKIPRKIQDFQYFYSDFVSCGGQLYVYSEPGLYRVDNERLVKLDVATDQFHAVACDEANTEILALERHGLRRIKFGSANSVSGSVQEQFGVDFYGVQGWLSPDEQFFIASNGAAVLAHDGSVGAKLRPGIVDLTFNKGQPLALESAGRLSVYTNSNDLITQIWVPAKTQFIEVVNDTVYLFQIINSELVVDSKVLTANLLGEPEYAKRSSYSYAITDNKDQVFLVDVEKRLIKRWSLQSGAFLSSIELPSAPKNVYFSESMNRLFVQYTNRIDYYEFKDGVVSSSVFVVDTIPTGEFFTLSDKAFRARPESEPGRTYFRYFALDLNGAIVTSTETDFLGFFMFEDKQSSGAMYNLSAPSQPSLYFRKIDTETGRTQSFEMKPYDLSLYMGRRPFYYPFKFNVNLRQFVTGAGLAFNVDNQKLTADFGHPITSAAWMGDDLYAIRDGGQIVDHWNSAKQKYTSKLLPNVTNAGLVNIGETLILIAEGKDGLLLTAYSVNKPNEQDSDGVPDLTDNCESVNNLDQLDLDGDFIGDACDEDIDGDLVPNQVETSAGKNPLFAPDFSGDENNNLVLDIDEYLSSGQYPKPILGNSTTTIFSLDFEGNDIVRTADVGNSHWVVIPGGYLSGHALASPTAVHSVAGEGGFADLILGNPCQESCLLTFFVQGIVPGTSMQLITDKIGFQERGFIELQNGWRKYQFILPANGTSIKLHFEFNDSDLFTYYGRRFLVDTVKFSNDTSGIATGKLNCSLNGINPLDANDVVFSEMCQGEERDDDFDVISVGDNCPHQANNDQADLDRDGTGDVCDADADGDGIENYVENQYSFMSRVNPADVALDYDQDGVNNYFEIINGYSPLVRDVHAPEQLFDFYPLGVLNYKYSDKQSAVTYVAQTKASDSNMFTKVIGDEILYYEARGDGIHLLKIESTSARQAIEFDVVEVPRVALLGQETSGVAKAKFLLDGKVIDSESVEYSSVLSRKGTMQYNNQSVQFLEFDQAVKFQSDAAPEVTKLRLLKGVGVYSDDELTLQSHTVTRLDPYLETISQPPATIPNPVNPEVQPTKKKKGGSIDGVWMLILSSLGLLFRRSYR